MGSIKAFIKKYISLIIPTGIFIVAIVVIVLSSTTKKSLAEDIESSSLAQSSAIKSLIRKTPPGKQYEQEKLYQDAYSKDAKRIKQLIKQSSLQSLINYNIFPKPEDTSRQLYVDFGKDYRQAIENLVKSINALDAPGEAAISEATRHMSNSAAKRTAKSKKNSENALVDTICRTRAESMHVYADPTIFKWYEFWDGYVYPGPEVALEDAWFSQLSYWVYDDVVATIRTMNANAECVYDAPVKRLVGIGFTKLADYETKQRRSSYANGDEAAYVWHESVQVLGVYPWSGRQCDDDIDVIHFSVAVVADSKYVIPFMKELCSQKEHKHREGYLADGKENTYIHNQITILQSETEPIVRSDEGHDNYRYGDDAIVKVHLICEYIFNRNGYDSIKPQSVKILLGQAEEEDNKKKKPKQKKKIDKQDKKKKGIFKKKELQIDL